MRIFAVALMLIAGISGANALECDELDYVYRQDVEAATGWNQMLPVEPEDAATVRFVDFPNMELTINGETKLYVTTSGGTGIRSRTAYQPDVEDTDLWYAFYDVSGRIADDQPDHFLILQGDLYWPECP